MSISFPCSLSAQNGVTPPMIQIPTIPSGTGTPKISFPSSEMDITPPIPILFSLFSISIVWSRQTPGISLKLAGNVPLPSVITFKTDVKLEFVNASRGVTDVFL